MNRLSENVSETPSFGKKGALVSGGMLIYVVPTVFPCDFVIHELRGGAATLLAVSFLPGSCCGS